MKGKIYEYNCRILKLPEYRQKEREKDNISSNQKYKEDEAYHQKERVGMSIIL